VGAVRKENFLLDAEALGLEARAEAELDEYVASGAALGGELGDPAGTTISALRLVEGTVRVHTGQSPTFAEPAGEEIPRPMPTSSCTRPPRPADASGEDAVVAGPLWSRPGAPADGRAHAVEDDVFYTGIGLRAAMRQLEELRELLVD